jgi:hypothetical protein
VSNTLTECRREVRAMSKEKSYYGLTIEFMDKFSAASKEEQSEMLEPMAVVMMWDSRMIDRNGMDNNQSKRFRELAKQVRPFIEAQPSGGIEMAEIERSGFMIQMLELQEIIEATKGSREILLEYLKGDEGKLANQESKTNDQDKVLTLYKAGILDRNGMNKEQRERFIELMQFSTDGMDENSRLIFQALVLDPTAFAAETFGDARIDEIAVELKRIVNSEIPGPISQMRKILEEVKPCKEIIREYVAELEKSGAEANNSEVNS